MALTKVTGSGIEDGTLSVDDIANDAVTADKLANSINTDIATGVTGNTTANAALPKAGGAMTGAITTTSTFDGRDVATDGSKLDAIEASADVTDTTNVTASGALMDSEVTNLAQVKAFDTTDYATAAQGTTADAALPKAGGTMTGTIADFTSTGIDDNATSTAITIDASENVGIGTTTPSKLLHLDSVGVTNTPLRIDASARSQSYVSFVDQDTTAELYVRCGSVGDNFVIDAGNSERLRITSDGRGLSQFTAKAWVKFNQTGTQSIDDNHNVSSLTDGGTGTTTINFNNALGSADFAPSCTINKGLTGSDNACKVHDVVSTTQLKVLCESYGGTNKDTAAVHVIVFGD